MLPSIPPPLVSTLRQCNLFNVIFDSWPCELLYAHSKVINNSSLEHNLAHICGGGRREVEMEIWRQDGGFATKIN